VTIRRNVIGGGEGAGRPVTIVWKGERIIAGHSLRAGVKEILATSKNLDVVKIGIMGEPATGKSTLAETLAHLIHVLSAEDHYVNWVYRVFGQEQFLDLEKTLGKLDVANYILYFHDLSFLSERGKIGEVKQAITKIRHLREDVKIVLIFDYHYTKGLDKYLRQSHFMFVTSVGSSEKDNMIEILGKRHARTISAFQRQFTVATGQKSEFAFSMKKRRFIYHYKNPFVVALFWNNAHLRYIIFPKRSWLAPVCGVCNPTEAAPDPDQIERLERIYGVSHVKAAAKKLVELNGVRVRNKNFHILFKKLYNLHGDGNITIEQLIERYKLHRDFQIDPIKHRRPPPDPIV